jgi:hypothetical protein
LPRRRPLPDGGGGHRNRDGLDPRRCSAGSVLKGPTRQHSYLRNWDALSPQGGEEELRKEAGAIEDFVIDLILQKKAVDEYNKVLASERRTAGNWTTWPARLRPRKIHVLVGSCATGNPKLAFTSPDAREDGVHHKAEKAERFRPPLYLIIWRHEGADRLKSSVPPQFT